MISLLAAAGIALAVMAGLLWFQTQRLDLAHDQLDGCRAENEIIGKQLAAQNKAVKQWQDTAEKRRKQAASALAKAQTDGQSQDAEIKRLRGVKATDCNDAVAKVRQGLNP
jgi:hypothetical protein